MGSRLGYGTCSGQYTAAEAASHEACDQDVSKLGLTCWRSSEHLQEKHPGRGQSRSVSPQLTCQWTVDTRQAQPTGARPGPDGSHPAQPQTRYMFVVSSR